MTRRYKIVENQEYLCEEHCVLTGAERLNSCVSITENMNSMLIILVIIISN